MELLITALPGVISALVASYAGFRLSNRALRKSERQSIRREAAADLSAPLRDLRSMARSWGRVGLTQQEVSSAVVAWSEAFDRQRHRLPPGWNHMGRSVLAAVGEVFGGVVFADVRPDMATYPLADLNFMWQDFTYDYITQVLHGVAKWGGGHRSGPNLPDFDSWLDQKGGTSDDSRSSEHTRNV